MYKLAVLALGIACIPVIAQETTGVILGSVKDSSGAVLPGAQLTITERTTGSVRTATSVLTSAAREGCRLAVVTAPDVTEVNARVREVCAAARIAPTSVIVAGPDPLDTSRRVSVTVAANFRVVTGNLLGPFSGTIPLQATAVMRHESF